MPGDLLAGGGPGGGAAVCAVSAAGPAVHLRLRHAADADDDRAGGAVLRAVSQKAAGALRPGVCCVHGVGLYAQAQRGGAADCALCAPPRGGICRRVGARDERV